MGSQHSAGVRELNSPISNRQSVQACMGGRVLTVARGTLLLGGPAPPESMHVGSKRDCRHFVADVIGDTGYGSGFRGLTARAPCSSPPPGQAFITFQI